MRSFDREGKVPGGWKRMSCICEGMRGCNDVLAIVMASSMKIGKVPPDPAEEGFSNSIT